MLIDHSAFKGTKISQANDVFEILKAIRKPLKPFDREKEFFYSIGITRRNTVRFIDWVSMGSLTGTVAEPRELYRVAIHQAASSIIVAHNHPSGNLKPSEHDINLTNKIRASGKIIGIDLIDHVIFCDGEEHGFYSFANEGLL